MLRKILLAVSILVAALAVSGWLVFGVFIYPGQSPHTGKTALINGHFITMASDTPEVARGKALLIEDGIITGFVDGDNIPSDMERIDLQGGYALPGFIDAHVHLGGIPIAEGFGVPAMILEFMRAFPHAREKFLRYGVTTIVSLGDGYPRVVELRDDIESGRLAGPRMVVAGPMLTSPGGHPVSTIFRGNDMAIRYSTRQLSEPQAARAEVDKLAQGGIDLVKVIYTAGRDDSLPRMNYAVLEAITDQAHQHDLEVVVHTDTQTDVEDALRAGADGLEHIALDLGKDTDRILGAIANQGIAVVPTLAVFDSHVSRERMDVILEDFSTWLAHDIPIVLGTDAGNLPAGESVYAEMRLYVKAGMSPYDALQTATVNAARHHGLDNMVGSLEPGKSADVIVFDDNPLEGLRGIESPMMVLKEGKPIHP